MYIESFNVVFGAPKGVVPKGPGWGRFWNNDVLNNMDDVLKVIWRALNEEMGDEKRKRVG